VEEVQQSEIQFATRWEFYLGGMAGMILGFTFSFLEPLSAPSLANEAQVLMGGLVASGRAILWFATFALLETVPWTASARKFALTAGVAALLLNLAVSGGIAFPSIAQPLWIVTALALNTMSPRRLAWPGRGWVGLIVPLPVLAAGCLVYLLFVLIPVSRAIGYVNEVRRAEPLWVFQLDPEWEKVKDDLEAKDRPTILRRNKDFLERRILPPLRKALKEDPGDVNTLTELPFWYGQQWKLAPDLAQRKTRIDPLVQQAQRIDPHGTKAYWTQYKLNVLYAQRADSQAEANACYRYAAEALARVIQLDPTNVDARYQYLHALVQSGGPADLNQITECQRLDRLATDPTRKLTDSQREQLQKWRDAVPHD
jgi:hypothetical protein